MYSSIVGGGRGQSARKKTTLCIFSKSRIQVVAYHCCAESALTSDCIQSKETGSDGSLHGSYSLAEPDRLETFLGTA